MAMALCRGSYSEQFFRETYNMGDVLEHIKPKPPEV